MAWRKKADPFPAPLREFREAEWPPVEGGCLGHYTCRANGYGTDCAPQPGEPCGQACYELLAREYPDRPEVLAAAKRADAFTRYHQARLSWLGEDHPGWIEEFFDGDRHGEIRYAPFRGPVAWRKRPTGDPYAEMPAELAVFDALEWAAPGETPDGNAFAAGDWDSTWDYHRCHDRYTGALIAWFDGHPDADFIEFLRERRARRSAS